MIIRTTFVLLFLALAVAGCGGPSAAAPRGAGNAADAVAVKVVRVEPSPIVRSITVTGTLAAEEQVMLSMKVTGRVDQMLVDLGSRVTRGQVVARLSATDFELRHRQAEAALQQARARVGLPADGSDDTVNVEQTGLVRQAAATLEEARRQHARMKTFATRGLSSKSELETAEAQLQIAEARYQDAMEEVRNRQALLAQRRSELALARQQLEDTVLRSPIDGVVRERLAVAGEYRAAGTPIVSVVRQHPLRLQLAVPERAAAAVRLGQPVHLTVEGDPTVYEGRVARVSPSITEGTRTLPLEAEVPNPLGQLRPGSFARAEIVTSDAPGLLVPQSALVIFAGVEKVFLIKDGKAREQRVRTGRRIDDRVEILEGLKAGDDVIVDANQLADGTAVTVSR